MSRNMILEAVEALTKWSGKAKSYFTSLKRDGEYLEKYYAVKSLIWDVTLYTPHRKNNTPIFGPRGRDWDAKQFLRYKHCLVGDPYLMKGLAPDGPGILEREMDEICLRGEAFMEQGRYKEALYCFLMPALFCLNGYAAPGRFLYSRGIIRESVGDNKGALLDFELAANEFPLYLDYWYKAAELAGKLGKMDLLKEHCGNMYLWSSELVDDCEQQVLDKIDQLMRPFNLKF